MLRVSMGNEGVDVGGVGKDAHDELPAFGGFDAGEEGEVELLDGVDGEVGKDGVAAVVVHDMESEALVAGAVVFAGDEGGVVSDE